MMFADCEVSDGRPGQPVRDTSGHVRGTTGRTTPPYKGVVRLSGVPHLPTANNGDADLRCGPGADPCSVSEQATIRGVRPRSGEIVEVKLSQAMTSIETGGDQPRRGLASPPAFSPKGQTMRRTHPGEWVF